MKTPSAAMTATRRLKGYAAGFAVLHSFCFVRQLQRISVEIPKQAQRIKHRLLIRYAPNVNDLPIFLCPVMPKYRVNVNLNLLGYIYLKLQESQFSSS
jgi:hypothetical protein